MQTTTTLPTLYYYPVSICSCMIRLLTREAGLQLEERAVDLGKFEQLAPEFLRMNPRGEVPVLRYPDFAIADSVAIAEILAAQFSTAPIFADNHAREAEIREWIEKVHALPFFTVTFSQSAVSESGSALQAQVNRRDEIIATYAAQNPALIPIYLAKKEHWRSEKPLLVAPEVLQSAWSTIGDFLKQVEERIASGPPGTSFLGKMFTAADCFLTPALQRFVAKGRADLIERLPRVSEYWKSVQARPAFAAVYRAS